MLLKEVDKHSYTIWKWLLGLCQVFCKPFVRFPLFCKHNFYTIKIFLSHCVYCYCFRLQRYLFFSKYRLLNPKIIIKSGK